MQSTETLPRVLVVDDMEPLLMILQKGLTTMGYAVSIALSGKEALRIFDAGPFDAVICDLAMEGLSGLEVAEAIRGICQAQSVARPAFVLLTGWGAEVEQSIRYADSGVDAVLTKPVEIPQLLDTLARLRSLRG